MTEAKKRLPFMSARQIALTAVIGGIAFICEAIGLWLPTPWPGGTINIGGFAITLAAMVAGPWAGMIVGWLDLFPMAGFGPNCCNIQTDLSISPQTQVDRTWRILWQSTFQYGCSTQSSIRLVVQ
jgi:hypothetical protein